MHQSFQSWVEEFQFSEDFRKLEKELSIGQPGEWPEGKPERPPSLDASVPSLEALYPHALNADETIVQTETAPETEEEEEDLLAKFCDQLAQGVTQRILSEGLMERLSKAEELQRDNAILATQVERLLKRRESLETRVAELEERLGRFKHLNGNLYLWQE